MKLRSIYFVDFFKAIVFWENNFGDEIGDASKLETQLDQLFYRLIELLVLLDLVMELNVFYVCLDMVISIHN